jgi:uncharacterized membrane protein
MNVKPIIITAIVMSILDTIYLTWRKDFYFGLIEKIQGSPVKIRMAGAVACYIIMILGLNYFIIQEKKSVLDAFLLGILIYGVFDTTTYAMFNNWTLNAAISDTLWGGLLFALTTKIVYTGTPR